MEITAAMVKELRETTGAGMMDCKKALEESEGDFDRAYDELVLGLWSAALAEESRAGDSLALVANALAAYDPQDGSTKAVIDRLYTMRREEADRIRGLSLGADVCWAAIPVAAMLMALKSPIVYLATSGPG